MPMAATPDIDQLLAAMAADRELLYKLRGLTAHVRVVIGEALLAFDVWDGVPVAGETPDGKPEITLSLPADLWRQAVAAPVPPPGYETLTMAFGRGAGLTGDLATVIAPYQAAWQRLYLVLRAIACGPVRRRPDPMPFRDTDTAVGRYRYIRANGVEARIYYEEAGQGPVPLLLQSTAGADGRQYRYLLADPEMQKRFRMIAYDLPYHGKSLPPIGTRWWEQSYRPTRAELMNWVVAIADALALDQPYFMGCSVGGQLALDLAAFHGDRFGAFISLNGWYDNPRPAAAVNNDLFRTPSISEDYPMSIILGGTAPTAPEATAQEVYWIYRSNFPGVYAGDNDYFMLQHDLKEDGHRINALAKPVYVIAGEYDSSARDAVHGAPAIAAAIPGVQVRVARGLGHFAPSDDPVAFGEMLLPVLDEILARTRRDACTAAEATP
jgi:pimeloyl-ACP methyl ester carboxylesterase